MKKLARLTALLLTGALLLALTACGAAPLALEQQAKQQLLGEINSYRATLEFAAPLEEVKQLSDAEQIWVEEGYFAQYHIAETADFVVDTTQSETI